MNSTRSHTIPQDWDEARDIPFFRVTAPLFSSAFCFGAGVLLASNDDHRVAPVVGVEPRAACAPPVTVEPVPELHRS